MNKKNTVRWQQTVQAWGIDIPTIQHFGLRYNNHGGLIYSSYPGHRRRVLLLERAADGTKNFWDKATEHLPMPALYNIAALDLPESKQRVYIANGEKSTMAMHTAGIPNTVNTFGEIGKIEAAVELLVEHQITEIFLAPDCDKTGLQAARKWQQIAEKAGIKVDLRDLRRLFEDVFHLSPEACKGFDLRDLWLRCGQNRELFHAMLQKLPPLIPAQYSDELPTSPAITYKPKIRKDRVQNGDSIDWDIAYYKWREDVIAVLDRVSPPPSGGKLHRHCPNPHHEDKHPSFRITPEGAPICTCQPGIKWNTLAEWLNVETWEDRKRQICIAAAAERIRKMIASPETICHFPQGIPDTLREQFLKLHRGGFLHDHAAALVVYELWHTAIIEQIWKPEAPVTVEKVLQFAHEATRATSEKTIRKGLMQLASLGFFAEIDPIRRQQRGRSTKQYRAQPIKTALAEFVEHMRYRLRERIFSDKTLDTITPDWFEGQPADIAEALAAAENKRRDERYKHRAKQRQYRELHYTDQIKTLSFRLHFTQIFLAHSTPQLEDRTWRTGREYRDAYYRVKALERMTMDKAISRRSAADQIGVSGFTLSVIRGREKIATEKQYITVEIKETENIMRRIDSAAYWAVNHRYGQFLESSDGERIRITPETTDKWIKPWVEKHMEMGNSVTAKIQSTSKERPATELEQAKFAKWCIEQAEKRKKPSKQTRFLPPRMNTL